MDSTLVLRFGLVLAGAALGGWAIVRNWQSVTTKQRFLWRYLIVLTFLLALFLNATKLPNNPRYTYPLLFASLLAWGCISDLFRRKSSVVIVWIVSLLLCIGTAVDTYRPLCKTGDWIRAAEFLSSHEKENQPIVVFISEVDTIVRYHYRGCNIVVPVPGPQRMDRYHYADFDIPDARMVEQQLEPILKNVDGCWLLTNEAAISKHPNGYHLQYLMDYLERDFEVVESADFVDSKVRRWQRK